MDPNNPINTINWVNTLKAPGFQSDTADSEPPELSQEGLTADMLSATSAARGVPTIERAKATTTAPVNAIFSLSNIRKAGL